MAYILSSGVTCTNISLDYGTSMTVMDGGAVNDTKLNYSVLHVSSGGIANNTLILNEGRLNVSSGGIANNTLVSSGGRIDIRSNGIANITTIIGGNLDVFLGGIANSTAVIDGEMNVSGGTVNCAMLYSGGKLKNKSGGKANSVAIYSGGGLEVSSGGTINNLVVNSGGRMVVSSGGTMTGQLIIEEGASASFDSHAILDFDISNLTPNNDAFVNNHNLVKGIPVYTLTVSETQVSGIYSLADYVARFDSTITVQDTSGEVLGTLLPNERLIIGDSSYTLNLDNSLTLTVEAPDLIAPTVSNIQASITTLTNQDVVLTADFADDIELEQSLYKLGEDGEWIAYSGSITVSENTTVFFKAIDAAGNETIDSYEVTNIDKAAPEKPKTSADITTPTSGDVLVSAEFSEDSMICEYSLDGKYWGAYPGGILLASNRKVYFRSIDAAGNISEVAEYEVTNIDRTAPNKPVVSADVTTPTNRSVTVSAKFDEDSSTKEYSLDGEKWLIYTNAILCVKNETVSFRGIDEAGNMSEVTSLEVSNIDTEAPSDPTGLLAIVSDQTVALLWNVSTDDFYGVKEYLVTYSLDGQDYTVRTSNTNYVLNNADFGSYNWSVQAVDFAGNESAIVAGDAFTVSGFKPYTVEYSADNFEHIITFAVTTPTLNAFRMPGGTYQMRVRQEGSSEWLTGDSIVAPGFDETPQLVKSDSDGNADVFFANPVDTWESGYVAQHVGSINDWGGTNEYASVYGKNKLADIIEGSTDANILLMTDDDNGDTLFVDDIYTASPGDIAEQQARIARIDEIRAGAGNDVVDMTSQQFEYVGDGLTIRGGTGNDIIWANKGDNWLFGDAGNDRIVGASGNDVIAGGIGNDRMHGGGGSDVFTFCDNWGADNVEQLESGTVTLWFVEGSIDNWDTETLTYADGENSVKVSGVSAEQITLKFGDNGSDEFGALSGMGAFFDATTERIFEESGKGMLASL